MSVKIHVTEIRVGEFEAESLEAFEQDYFQNALEYEPCLDVKDTIIVEIEDVEGE